MIDGYEVVAWSSIMQRMSICFTQTEEDARRIVKAYIARYGGRAHYNPVGLYDSEETDIFIRMAFEKDKEGEHGNS